MGNVLIKEETMTAIAEAIREKHGSEELYKPDEMPEAIKNVPSSEGEGPDMKDPIRFWGADGILLYSYTMEEMHQLTELPKLPQYPGLISQGWNWTLEGLKEHNREAEVGAVCVTDDGSTRIYIELFEGALNPILGFAQTSAHSVKVDWGDGSELETSGISGSSASVDMSHEYASPGEYVIRLIPDDGAKIYFIGVEKGTYLLRKVTEYNDSNYLYRNAIKKIEIGKGVALDRYALSATILQSIVIPEDILSVGSGSFNNCYGLRHIIFPKKTATIPSSGCLNCYTLKVVSISEEAKRIDTSCFEYCYSLERVTVPDAVWVIGNYAMHNCYGIEKFVVPKSLGGAAMSTFDNCQALKTVIFPEEIEEIKTKVFSNCRNLTKVVLPQKLTLLDGSAFSNCISLKEIVLPETLKTIGASTFAYCHSLAKMVIPAQVTSIGSGAFSNCTGIRNYYLYPTTPPTLGSTSVFSNLPEYCKIHVPKGCLEAYQTATNWSTYADYMVEMEE